MDGDLPLAKRPRLSMACNECRRRKVKCDTDVPRCQNCRLRNDVCTTTDPKRPSVAISREWIEQTETPRINQVNQHTMSRNIISSQSPRALPAAKGSANYSPRSIAATVSCTEEKGPSPAQQPYDMAFNMDNSTDRIKMMGASSSQCLMKSLDVYLESAQIPSLSGNFRYGMRQAEEMEIPLLNSFPALPEPDCLNRYVTAFFDRIHRLYPLFDIDKIKDTIRHFASMRDFHSLTPDNIPLLVSAYLIVSLGADEEAEQLTDDGTKYLVAAASLVGHIILVPYLSTVQALLLFTIAYRGRNKDGVGWQMLGMAIRISYTLGLHRHSAKNPSIEHGVQLHSKQLFHARIWAICCSFEMMMQLESGRPSMIQEVDRDHMMGPDQHPRGHDFLQWHMGLAQHQRLISHHIYGHRPGDRTGREILSDTARLDRSLLSWARDIPEEFRPGNDLFCSTHEFHIAALLSVQYYQTVIALHRAALISPAPTFLSEVASHCFDDSLSLRLQAGEAICVSSARSIARLAIELSDRKIQSRILNAGPPLLACIVLGISLMKNPAGRIMASDLELLKACAEYTADQFLQTGHNALFANGVISIYQQVHLHISRKSNEQHNHVKITGSNSTSGSVTDHHIPNPRGEDRIQVTSKINQNTLPDDILEMTNQSNTARINHTPGVTSQSFHSFDSSLPNGVTGLNMPTQEATTSSYQVCPDPLPFDSLNVQDLWTWMGDLDGYNNYSFLRSHETNGTM